MLGSREAGTQHWRADGPIFVMPFIDPEHAQRTAQLMASRAGCGGLLLAVHDDARDGFIALANRIFMATESRYFGYVAQDAFPGRYWLRLALTAFEKPENKLVGFNDGKWFGKLASYGIARRDWAEKVYGGPLFFPQYRRHYADAELSLIAAQEKGLGFVPNSVLIEVDWEKEEQPVEAADRRLFAERAKAGFDGRVTSKELREQFA